ncbi:hypothetical protein HOC80_00030 [archaeon]|jgi:large subunit ribosomal protein L31e|nr:hypothetical protein [archaeon]MBT4416471.1 hypothetical protein [archaeon]
MAERKYIIPLRKEYQKAPIYARTKKAVKAIRQYLAKHMKNENVKLGRQLNMYLWQNGNRNPPHKVEVIADIHKDKDSEFIMVELAGHSLDDLRPKVEVKKASGIAGKLEEKLGGSEKKSTEKKKMGVKKADKKVVEEEKKAEVKKAEVKKADKQVVQEEKKVEEKKEAEKVIREVPLEEGKEKVSEAKIEEKEVKQEQKVERAEKKEGLKK